MNSKLQNQANTAVVPTNVTTSATDVTPSAIFVTAISTIVTTAVTNVTSRVGVTTAPSDVLSSTFNDTTVNVTDSGIRMKGIVQMMRMISVIKKILKVTYDKKEINYVFHSFAKVPHALRTTVTKA
jgi:glyoxylate utilization-related uncharacterized protein